MRSSEMVEDWDGDACLRGLDMIGDSKPVDMDEMNSTKVYNTSLPLKSLLSLGEQRDPWREDCSQNGCTVPSLR